MKDILKCLHNRHEFLEQRYGKPVRIAAHAGEGAYLGGSLFLSHEVVYYVYGAMLVVWVVHTIVIGFGQE